jgi:hypothetical protein
MGVGARKNGARSKIPRGNFISGYFLCFYVLGEVFGLVPEDCMDPEAPWKLIGVSY